MAVSLIGLLYFWVPGGTKNRVRALNPKQVMALSILNPTPNNPVRYAVERLQGRPSSVGEFNHREQPGECDEVWVSVM